MLAVAHATLPPPSRETDRRERERREDRGSPVLFLAYRVVSVALLALLPYKTKIWRFPVFAALLVKLTSTVPHASRAVYRGRILHRTFTVPSKVLCRVLYS